MPRVSPRLFQHARKSHPLLPLLLRATHDLPSARDELRWLKEYALAQAEQRRGPGLLGWRYALRQLCNERARGKPLQYLLGSEYFGDLEIACRPGVLIPRQETAASVMHLVKSLAFPPTNLKVLDLCTGTGCIPLLFHHEFLQRHPDLPGLKSLGVDLSAKAVQLARTNLERQRSETGAAIEVDFVVANVIANKESTDNIRIQSLASILRKYGNKQSQSWDILISNPPYISPREFQHTTSRSVRNFEPRLALVPEEQHQLRGIDPGDVFYPRLLDIALEQNAKIILFEVADMEQARRVASMIKSRPCWTGVEIWRDDPACMDDVSANEQSTTPDTSGSVGIVGSGNGRSVFAWRDEACKWLGR